VRPPIDGSTALVTGASAGIGREIARQLAPRVRKLVLAARRADRLEAVATELKAANQGLEVATVTADVRDLASLDALCAAAGDVDILINNAGLGDQVLFADQPWERMAQMIETNITALTYLTRKLLPGMLARGKGGVLNVSSGFGLQFLPGMAVYVGTKHYVTGFTESLRLEVGRRGVVVSQVCPGPVATEFGEVAGNTVKVGLVEISAESCARTALRGFDRGKALIVPGFLIRLAMGLGAWTPRWLLRFVMGQAGRRLGLLGPRS